MIIPFLKELREAESEELAASIAGGLDHLNNTSVLQQIEVVCGDGSGDFSDDYGVEADAGHHLSTSSRSLSATSSSILCHCR